MQASGEKGKTLALSLGAPPLYRIGASRDIQNYN